MSDSATVSRAVEGPEDFESDCARWHAEIRQAQKECETWWKQSREILQRYRDDRPGRRDVANIRLGRQMNLLWSNVETLRPAIYAAVPDPVVQRRFTDEDDVSRVASMILQRTLAYQMEENEFHQLMQEVVQDHLISGRGTVWLRYEPHFGREPIEPIPPPTIVPPHPQTLQPGQLPGSMPGPGMPPQPGPGTAPPMPPQPGPGTAPRGVNPSPPMGQQPGWQQLASGQQPGWQQLASGQMGQTPAMQQTPPGGSPPLPGGMPGVAGVAPPPAPVAPPLAGASPPPGGSIPGPATPPPILPQVSPIPSPQPLLSALLSAQMPAEAVPRETPARQRGGVGRTPDDGGVQIHGDPEGEGEFLAWETVRIDHVGWEDWLSNPARTWAELRWVARRVFMTKDQVADRFGPRLADEVPLAWHPADLTEQEALEPKNQLFCRAEVWEIWDKPSRKVVWIAKNFGERLLDKRDDPLRLPGFFPTPRPLYATLTTDTLVPVPDYIEYRDQAAEIDNLTARIHAVGRAIKVAGVYDASQTGIERLFTEGVENELVPVNTWMTFAQQGGLKGCIDLLPVDTLAEVLERLVAIRSQAKQDLYEVTGISDIIRGSTVASETATAQQIKSQFGTMRLRARQADAARFCRDVIRIMADIVCEHFQARTLLMMSDVAHQQSNDATLAMPAIALLKDDKTRPLRIDIETDSTIVADQQQEQQQRIQFLTMAGQFLQQALPAVQQNPQIAPLMGQMLLFGIRSFPKGAELEGQFESAVKALQQMPAQGPPPDPKMLLAQAQVQNIQSQIADRQMRSMGDVQKDRAEAAEAAAKASTDSERMERESFHEGARLLHDIHSDRTNHVLEAAKLRAQSLGRVQ